MELKQLVIRELIKDADDNQASVSDRGGASDVEQPVTQELGEALVNAFNRRSALTHGSFNVENEDGYPFISAFNQYLQTDRDESAFLQLTEQSMAQLAAAIATANGASGGYILFALYQSDRYEFLLAALMRDRSGISLNGDLQPTEIFEVDLDKLHQAMRVNVTNYLQKKDGYLSFIGNKENGNVTQYFSNAFGCTDVTPSRKSTSELIKAAREYCNINELHDQKEEIIEDLVTYMEKQRGEKETATLPDVQQIFDAYIPPEQAETAAGTFGSFANKEPYQVSHEFQPHTSTLNAYNKVKARGESWSLDFSKRSLGTPGTDKEILFDEGSNSLTLRGLPDKVIEKIRAALSNQD